MKVRELIELLSKEDPEREVILSKDSEGNGFSPLADHGLGWYRPDTTWSGEYVNEDERDELPEPNYKALTLWPKN